ncbi:MAG TPA: sulfatase [Bryobacteraceae bacterium]|jgi:arylsulfatase A-like enzyme|nr:sulfatase [Bryobacteraceae bacterium]
MNRRTFLQSGSLGAASALMAQQYAGQPAGQHAAEPTPNPHPNVIWILGDQFRAQALASNGDPNARTPNLDRASINGVTFQNHLSGFPLCCPFRGSMLTSRYPHHCVPGHEYPLPKGQKTIADVFNSNGYRTAYFGKWHLGGWHEQPNGRAAFFITDPARRGGFQNWTGYENNNSQWDSWVHGGSGASAFHYRLPGYETDELTNLLIGYVKERAEERKTAAKPFFAVLSVQPPHDPYVAPERFMQNYNPERMILRPDVAHVPRIEEQVRRDLAGYYAMIENLDWNYGRVVRTLEETGLLADTHIFFFADHGDMHGSHGMFRKICPYEESIRTPFILSGGVPRYSPWKNGRLPVLSNHVDIAPTTLGLCGIRKPEWMEGADLSYHRIGNPPAAADPDSAYLQCVVTPSQLDTPNTPYRGLVTRDGWKYVCFENRSWLQFNLNEDAYEEVNLAQMDRYRPERKKLIARLKQWVADTGDKFAIPED